MDQQKEKDKDDKKPGVPTLKDAAQKPQLKIKGLKSGQSLLERLKQFKKKDLAFIAAGLGVLFMAPLAEHFMMSPDNGQGIKEGWNIKPGAGGLGGGGSPFEPGAGGMAPGDLAGAGSDVITPLNVRDPSALIMGPGATAQPPATSSNASGQAPKESSDWKDALSQSAARAAGAASRAATPLPPLPQLSGGGLRGLGTVSGGGGASYSLPAINAGNVPNRGGGGGSLGLARPTAGYNGAAVRGQTNGGNLDALKAAAAKAGADFNRGGAAGSALQAAAATNMGSGSDSGGAGQGGPGMGADKALGQSQNKNAKSEGESLAFLAAKENQEQSIQLKWKLIEKKEMLWPDLKEKMTEELMMTPLKEFTKGIADQVSGFMGGKADQEMCYKMGSDGKPSDIENVPKSDIAKTCSTGGVKTGEGSKYCWCHGGPQADLFGKDCTNPYFDSCTPSKGGGDDTKGANKFGLPSGTGDPGDKLNTQLDQLCTRIENALAETTGKAGMGHAVTATGDNTPILNSEASALADLIAVNKALAGSSGRTHCGGATVTDIITGNPQYTSVTDLLQKAQGMLAAPQGALIEVGAAVGIMGRAADALEFSKDPGASSLSSNLNAFASNPKDDAKKQSVMTSYKGAATLITNSQGILHGGAGATAPAPATDSNSAAPGGSGTPPSGGQNSNAYVSLPDDINKTITPNMTTVGTNLKASAMQGGYLEKTGQALGKITGDLQPATAAPAPKDGQPNEATTTNDSINAASQTLGTLQKKLQADWTNQNDALNFLKDSNRGLPHVATDGDQSLVGRTKSLEDKNKADEAAALKADARQSNIDDLKDPQTIKAAAAAVDTLQSDRAQLKKDLDKETENLTPVTTTANQSIP